MSSKYAKLSNEIMVKKATALRLQVIELLSNEFLKNNDMLNMVMDKMVGDKVKYLDDEVCVMYVGEEDRPFIETMCDDLSQIIPKIKRIIREIEMIELEREQAQFEPSRQKPTYTTIANMDELKRAFHNRHNMEDIGGKTFVQLLDDHPFVYLTGTYKHASDMTGKPDFIVKNFNNSFAKRLEDEMENYLFVKFVCLFNEATNSYQFMSYWIINTLDPMCVLHLAGEHNDIDFADISKEEVKNAFNEQHSFTYMKYF